MPKRIVTTQVYEIEAPEGKIRVTPEGSSVRLEQHNAEGPSEEIVLDLHAWLALCDLRDTVKPKRARKKNGAGPQ
jgi:hypothetical protein